MTNIAIIIPSRLDSTRLPQKPLAKIANLTMIEQVVIAAKHTPYDVYVATDSRDIANLSAQQGAIPVMTEEHATGTERVFAATEILGLSHDVIINLQGDMPFIEPSTIIAVANMCQEHDYDITTAVAKADASYAQSLSNVKAIIDGRGKALYFSRSMIPHNSTTYLCHIGIYAFKRPALKKFCQLAHTNLEKTENLEQLRALYHGMSIGACIVDNMPISVDTPDDLQNARDFFTANQQQNG